MLYKAQKINLYILGPPSGLDKDLAQWVFYPLLFNLMSMHWKIPFKEKLLVLNTCYIF